eukprot:NODE_13151_length_1182_cov_3.857820.p1 GENE.NODE_13151_length_1182_cov_3.857820~~NODE_13151_length_1182_cov_3.857820.p1  ORF type:complete len:353 (-),score=63.28 NODE_13151_length_1182_cov_3.857820:124-1122(-)
MARASDAVTEMLLKAHPGAVKEKDRCGRLPLHVAFFGVNPSDAVIEMLLKAHPDAVKERDLTGRLPLHFSLLYQPSAAVLTMILKAYPDATKERDELVGALPLHKALWNRHQKLIDGHGNKDENEDDPLIGTALEEARAFDAIIEMLIKAHPDAATELDVDGDTPLHKALAVRASGAVIEMLLKAHPDASKERDGYGRLPLHSALDGHGPASEAVIAMLLKACPDAAKERDGLDGTLPLHIALRKKASDAVIAMLFKEQSDISDFSPSDIASFVYSVHHSGVPWKMCIQRTMGQVLAKQPAHLISNFVCGKCACELCCRPRPEAEAAPGGDE